MDIVLYAKEQLELHKVKTNTYLTIMLNFI